MKNIWFTSDHHFGHKNIIEFVNRPFTNVEEMDEVMLQRWNQKIMPNDDVYYLGDLSFHKVDRTLELLYNLNGRIHFILGNHDKKRFNSDIKHHFVWIKDYYELKIDDHRIVMCHYPFQTWNASHYGSWHLHGHAHSKLRNFVGGRLNVCADLNNFFPWSYDDVCEYMNNNKYDPVEHHGA